MPRGRPKNPTTKIRKRIYLPEDLVRKYDIMLADPRRGKPTHGAYSEVAETLMNCLIYALLAKTPEEKLAAWQPAENFLRTYLDYTDA